MSPTTSGAGLPSDDGLSGPARNIAELGPHIYSGTGWPQNGQNEFNTPHLRADLGSRITRPELSTVVDYVLRVIWLHKSNGLMADLVAVVGCIDGIISSQYDPHYPIPTRERWNVGRRASSTCLS